MSATKQCTKCKETKPMSGFCKSARAKDGLQGWCKVCHVSKNRSHFEACKSAGKCGNHSSRDAAPGKTMCQACLDRRTDSQQKKKYGITSADKAALLASQGGGCAICGTTQPKGCGWHTDHYSLPDGTPVVRGILCTNCNVGIGNLRHDPAIFEAAIAYVRQHNAYSNDSWEVAA